MCTVVTITAVEFHIIIERQLVNWQRCQGQLAVIGTLVSRENEL